MPGDSAVVTVTDPVAGIADDFALGGKKIYAYVAVWPLNQPAKTGANLSGGTRWPLAGTQVIDGVTWTCLRLDSCVVGGFAVANKFCLDLKDDLFTPGDTVCFFYGAENTDGVRTYAFGSNLGAQGDDLDEAAANASEFTCLPAGGWNNGGEILYVDGMDGRGAQPYWDTALQALQLFEHVDRYDVRGPSSGIDNRVAGRVKTVTQLLDCYRVILWDCGDLPITLGDGSGFPERTDDYGLLGAYLSQLAGGGGVYICGDDVAQQLNSYASASAVTFKTTYLPYTLIATNHRPGYGISPLGKGVADGCFAGDTFYISGGCPLLNDFDVMDPKGTSSMEVSYGEPTATNGAVISNRTNNGISTVGVLLSGYSLIYVRDDDYDGIPDRAAHLQDVIQCLFSYPVSVADGGGKFANGLSQNYPNPFNPQTTIAFSLKERGRVSLAIFNVAGERVRTLAEESLAAGPHTKVWDGRDNHGQPVSSGVYFYRLRAAGYEQTRKMVLLK
jgi:hypothetical protein